MALEPWTVADFYAELFRTLTEFGLDLTINTTPNEIVSAIPFEQDREHASYDPEYANRFGSDS